MAAVSTIIFQAALVLLPALVAALGGIISYRLREAKRAVVITQSVCALVLISVGCLSLQANPSNRFWLVPVIIGGVIALHLTVTTGWFARLGEQLVASSRVLAGPRRWGLVLMGLCPLLFGFGFWQVNAMTTLESEIPLNPQSFAVPDLEVDHTVAATTDHGTLVPLYKHRGATEDSLAIEGDQGLPMENSPLPYRAVRLSEPDSVSNCAGWVFADAQRWIQCRDVQQILNDNGYRALEIPVPGDIAIYRDNTGAVTHVARVVALLKGNRPLIESKWGYQGVFLHLAEGTPYGLNYQFYHSPRSGHLLALSNSSEQSGKSEAEVAP